MADDPEAGIPRVQVESAARSIVVRVGGEMDIDRAPLLHEALDSVITRPDCPVEIVVDLAELTFCDSSGLNALLQARLTAEQHGRRIRLHAPSPQVIRLLEVTGADQLFPVTDT
ncbi:STAS domain-containing protein [Streptomyces sp. NPDC051364]|uniref:STAS domain-containing protein n=1 Tax=Streptomyces sp. NPDC051364 TaxID=3155799 RepID=UPI003437D28D